MKKAINTLLALILSACASQAVPSTVPAQPTGGRPTATQEVQATEEAETIEDIVLVDDEFITNGMITGFVGSDLYATPWFFQYGELRKDDDINASYFPVINRTIGNIPISVPFSFEFSWQGKGYTLDDLHINLGGRVLLDGKEIASQHELNWIEGIDGYFMAEVPFVLEHPLMLQDTDMHEITLELQLGKNGQVYEEKITYFLTANLMTEKGEILERPSGIPISFAPRSLSEFSVGNYGYIRGRWTTDALAQFGGKDILKVLVDFDYGQPSYRLCFGGSSICDSLDYHGQDDIFQPDAVFDFDISRYSIPGIHGFGKTQVIIINKMSGEVLASHTQSLLGFGKIGYPDKVRYDLGLCPDVTFNLVPERNKFRLTASPELIAAYGDRSLAMTGHIKDGEYFTSIYNLAHGETYIPKEGLAWVAIGTYVGQDFRVCSSDSYMDVPIQVYGPGDIRWTIH